MAKNKIIESIKTFGDILRSITPIISVLWIIVMLLLSTYITTKLIPLNESINANTTELKRVVAREQDNRGTFERFEETVTLGFKTLGDKVDKFNTDFNTRLSRIEGKLE